MKKVLILFTILFPSLALAQSGFNNIGDLVSAVISLLFSLGGVVATIGIIISGYKYISSLGDPEATAQAKNALLYSVIGLVVILTAVAVVRTLMNQLGVTNINIFGL
jgi:hypothetical protein